MLGYYLFTQQSGDTKLTNQTGIIPAPEDESIPQKESSGLQVPVLSEKNTTNQVNKTDQPEPVKENIQSENRIKKSLNQPERNITTISSKPGSTATRKETIQQPEPDQSFPVPGINTPVDPRNQTLPGTIIGSKIDSLSDSLLKKKGIPVQQPFISPTESKDTLFAEIEEIKKETPLVLPDSVGPEPAKPIKLRKKSLWEFAIALKPGLSNVREGNIFEGGTHARDVFASPNAGSGTNFAPFAVVPPQQVPHETFSWGIELSAQKKISKRFMLLAGLEYTDLRSKINVGKHIDSAGSLFSSNTRGGDYYQAPGTVVRSYFNNYHLLGVRAGLSWTVFKSNKFGLRWENALVLQQLIASSGLHYDPIKGVYYRDFSPYRKTQVMGSTGFAIPLLSQQKLNLELLPAVSYGFTPLLKQSSNSPSHFINYSIGLRFLFPKR